MRNDKSLKPSLLSNPLEPHIMVRCKFSISKVG